MEAKSPHSSTPTTIPPNSMATHDINRHLNNVVRDSHRQQYAYHILSHLKANPNA